MEVPLSSVQLKWRVYFKMWGLGPYIENKNLEFVDISNACPKAGWRGDRTWKSSQDVKLAELLFLLLLIPVQALEPAPWKGERDGMCWPWWLTSLSRPPVTLFNDLSQSFLSQQKIINFDSSIVFLHSPHYIGNIMANKSVTFPFTNRHCSFP